MRLIARIHDEDELSRIKALMRFKGVPLYVRDAGPPRGFPKWLVFACINGQAGDAARILRDPEHEPMHPVNVDEFEQTAYKSNFGVMIKWGVLVAMIALICVVGAVWLTRRYGV